ncbi:MAG: glucosidase [Deltaproteobacteria bacterium]|nr:glucosidase [Deltaproteobacteria bacterium]
MTRRGPQAELHRLHEDQRRLKNWKRWGPYLAERQWGTVREDYSAIGDPWSYFTHEQARLRAYRWGEDGLLGFTDRECRLCFAIALWNERDPILKERLFGLSGHEGNHGEDVKECYYYLDSTPTHSYAKALYKYPQAEFPYQRLVEENRRRGREQRELELTETGIFDGGRYFDVLIEYAKASPDDLLIRITLTNRGPETAPIHLLPTLWARNSWAWGCTYEGCWLKPRIVLEGHDNVVIHHQTMQELRWVASHCPHTGESPRFLFTENESNTERLWGVPSYTPYVKDAFHRYLVNGEQGAVNHATIGSKVAVHYRFDLPPGASVSVPLRLFDPQESSGRLDPRFDEILEERRLEADAFYDAVIPAALDADAKRVARQAYAGLLWSKQFYHYVVNDWLDGDPHQPKPPPERKHGRNKGWRHLFCRDVILMPDKWEYPWFAAWDLAFHVVPLARIDPELAKRQLLLFMREWYMHPSGQLPAYEFALDDVNPPVHAWACWRVFRITAELDKPDHVFLARAFHKLMLNFTWWVNRKDDDGDNVFGGGFLGLDNIGVFDRSRPLPTGGKLQQADGTAWMAFFCGTMLAIALELARVDPVYEDVASKFFEHFLAIADAMNTLGGTGLWHEEDGFYYDQLAVHGHSIPLRLRSLVGIIPVLAAGVLDQEVLDHLPGFSRRMHWFLENREDLARAISYLESDVEQHPRGRGVQRLLAIPSRERLARVLRYVFDEEEFLSPYGVRSLSRVHGQAPYSFRFEGVEHKVDYQPGESNTGLFGGNSNWRGPIWFPINYLLLESLERYHRFYGDSFQVEVPTGSGRMMNLAEAARELSRRMSRLFLADAEGRRPVHGADGRYASDPAWKKLVLFHEYFHGETGEGLGASHQTGWTALITECLRRWLDPLPFTPRPDQKT